MEIKVNYEPNSDLQNRWIAMDFPYDKSKRLIMEVEIIPEY